MSEQVSEIINGLDGQERWLAFGDTQATLVSDLLPAYFATKGFYPEAIGGLARDDLLGPIVDELFLGNRYPRDDRGASRQRQRFINVMTGHGYAELAGRDHGSYTGVYEGSVSDNASIIDGVTDAALRHGRHYDDNAQRQFRRNGASRALITPGFDIESAGSNEQLANVPIAIVGGGASGVLACAHLCELGFRNVTIFDKRGRLNGIWKQSNVYEGSKNNPFEISFGDAYTNEFGGRIAGSGKEIDEFLDEVEEGYHQNVKLKKARVESVEPSDLNHRVTYVEDGETKSAGFPIVIYAPGIGSPLDPSDAERMTTPHENGDVGRRWQQQFSEGDVAKLGKRVVLIGLGNSTAEVVHQLQGYDHLGVDYRILTHRSLAALQQPHANVDGNPIYRDIQLPNLVKVAGDLGHIDRMFTRARDSNRILTNVREWSHESGILKAVDVDGIETRIPYDTLFTLIGYGQKLAVNAAMGLTTLSERTGTIAYDFDGEVQRGEDTPGFGDNPRRRTFPGYFALGPILQNGHNPNAEVIPGIQYQIQFLTSTLLVRAAEVAFSKAPAN